MGSSINLKDFSLQMTGEPLTFQQDSVADLLSRQSRNFPGAQPVSFAREHLEELQRADYFMCEKTDGIRCLLYLTHTMDDAGEFEEAQFLIDRRNDYYYVFKDTLHVPRPDDFARYHTGTLLDGELVQQRLRDGRRRIAYLVFDCLAMDGRDLTSRTFDRRLAAVQEGIEKPLKAFRTKYGEDVARQPFEVHMKDMQFPYGAEMMFKDVIPKLPHGNDGLIFTCRVTPYIAGTDRHVLKWKPPQENTVDFRLLLGAFPMLEDADGVYEDWDAKPETELHVNHGGGRGGGYQRFADLAVADTEWEGMKRMNQQLDGRVIECYRDPATKEWRPKMEPDGTPRFRDDKKDSNHIDVVHSVLQSIEDAVSEQDLISNARLIRAAFKERQRKDLERKKREEDEERRKREEARVKQVEEEQRRAGEPKEEMDYDGPGYSD